jgi:type IV pilus assembly protein PilQ
MMASGEEKECRVMKKTSALGLLAAAFFLIPSWGLGAQGEVRKLEFSPGKEKSTFTVFFEGKGAFRVFQSESQGSVVVEADNLLLPARLTKLLDSAGTSSPVIQVTPYAAGDNKHPISKFVLQLKDQVDVASNQAPGKFQLELKAKKEAGAKGKKNKVVPTLAKAGWSETDAIKSRKSAADKGEEVAKRLMEVLDAAPEDKAYFGSRVTFEGNQVDVHDIFRLIGDASGLNIMTDSDVEYKADFSVTDIPWDQLLEIVLDQAQLKAKAVGNVIRIISGERFAKEQEAKLREIDIADENEPVVIAIVPLSFSTAEDVRTMVEALLVQRDSSYNSRQNDPNVAQNYVLNSTGSGGVASGGVPGQSHTLTTVAAAAKKIKLAQDFIRGKIEVDSRSNSLVITNTKRAIERIKRLVKELDVALPQILIDAKIIIASESFSRSLGVNWGGRATSGGTGRAGIGGTFNNRQITLGDGEDAAAFAISSAANRGALGFQIGAGRHGNLSAQLNLAEANGISKTVASPRVVVNNKKTAEVLDGQTIFISSDPGANAAGTLTPVRAALALSVTPQVTSVGSVLLDLVVAKDAPKIAAGSPPAVENKQIRTQVLVDSGNTLVLGGVYQNVKTKNESGIPLLMNLPFIGSFFRTNDESDDKSELMVFITPEIVDVKGATEASSL